MCGGSGSRLWPLSREHMPKQLLTLAGTYTLLQSTALRAMAISGVEPHSIVTITLNSIREEVVSQFHSINPALTTHILGEPVARNTSGAVAYAAYYIKEVFGPDSIMWVLPSDHYIASEEKLEYPFRQALEAAENDYLVTFGIKPTRPETGYGYIKPGRHIKNTVFEVEEFVEKPDLKTAQDYLDSGLYSWNSGMFLFKADAALENFRTYASDTYETVQKVMKAHSAHLQDIPAGDYARIPSQPFDVAIMEKAENIAVVMDSPAVSDIGSWTGLWNILDKDDHNNSVTGRVRMQDCHDSLIQAQSRLVVCAGLKDMVVVETPDSVLITTKDCSDSIKPLIAELKNTDTTEAIKSTSGSRSWGSFKILSRTSDYEIREIIIYPAHTQNLQFDHHSRHWTIIEGEATITIDNNESVIVGPGGSMSVAEKVPYRISNFSSHALRFLEIQYRSSSNTGI
jgi:mannose-1-phosphate guanylyltransferase/mannose-6-phosphate isomerase